MTKYNLMNRTKIFIYLFILLFSQNLFAQIDTVTFRFEPDYATFKIKCQAQKVKEVSGETIIEDFQITDTINSAYTFNWGGNSNIGLVDDGLPVANYEFTTSGVYVFDLSVYENVTGKTFLESKTFEILDIIKVPNVFTPNGDGVNDLFIIRANGMISSPLEISIFSRTGTLIYSEKAPIIVWDGKNSSGSELSEGIYFYILKTGRPGFPDQQGFFHLYNKEL